MLPSSQRECSLRSWSLAKTEVVRVKPGLSALMTKADILGLRMEGHSLEILYKILSLFLLHGCFVYVYACLPVEFPVEVRRGHQISWHRGYRWLPAIAWVVGVEPGSSASSRFS